MCCNSTITMRLASFIATLYLVVSSLIAVVDSAETVGKNGKVFRHDHLDYLDVETMKYYIENTQETLDYDVAIMFYAQWSSHCHSLAPTWDQISRVLKAGTKESKIVIGLFDCEDSKEHEKICQQLHIKQYPTLAYFSMAGKNHHLSMRSPKHVTQYKGNWQYGDAILDWVKAVSALSQYHRSGWGNKIRSTIFGSGNKRGRNQKKPLSDPLPIGIPQSRSDSQELQSLRKEMNKTVSLAVRTSSMMQAIFLPELEKGNVYPTLSDYNKNYTDMYAMLQGVDAWGKQSQLMTNVVLRTCVTELTMDYCDRIATQYMETWIDKWPLNQTITDEIFDDYQSQIAHYINQTEPQCYYYVVENVCTISNFTNTLCQPKTCPFQDRTACRFLTACLTDQLYTEYAEALQLSSGSSTEQQQKQSKKDKKKGGFSWGL
jgi:thiol-disulfide isomerase/thioredoxin